MRQVHAMVRLRTSIALFVALAAPASAAAPPAGVVAAILADQGVADCFAQSHLASKAAFVAKAFDFQPVRLRSGARMTVARGMDACVCAAQNCPTFVLYAETGGRYRTVLSDFTIESNVAADGTATMTAHDSAAVSNRSIYRWDGKRYALVRSERVDLRSATVKPMNVALSFAPGASSATVSGRAAFGFGDTYVLRAKAGQTLSLRLTTPVGKPDGRVTIFFDNGVFAQAGTHWTGRLKASGTYSIAVDGAGETLQPYSLTVAIH
jgi:hypothetical protein